MSKKYIFDVPCFYVYEVEAETEEEARKIIRRSIILKVDVQRGDKITLDKIKFARPGTGIPTNEFKFVDGRKVKQNLLAETVLQWNMFTE